MPPQVETAWGTVNGSHIGGSRGLSKSVDSQSLALKLAQACYGLPSVLVKLDESLLRGISEDHPCSCGNHIIYSRAWLTPRKPASVLNSRSALEEPLGPRDRGVGGDIKEIL